MTRPRRSASRPAGPPPELPEEPASVPVTVVAAQAAPSVAEVQPVRTKAVQRAAGEPAPDAGRGRRTRSRAAAPSAEAAKVSEGTPGAAQGGPEGAAGIAQAGPASAAGAAQGVAGSAGAPVTEGPAPQQAESPAASQAGGLAEPV
ncbi:MAG: hypothetical protein HOV97_11780, partial [Nonomuraea sp.]|nr:hypothetical protein [Nonomuraea sp.]